MTLRDKLGALAIGAVAVLPWVFYTDGGPSVTIARWALALVCCGVLLFAWPQGRSLLPASLLAAALCTSVIGLVQYLGDAAHLAPWVSAASAGSFLGNLRQPNQAATLMNMGLAVVVMGALRARAWGLWALMATALLALGISLTGSRTGMLQMGMVYGAFAWWAQRERVPWPWRWHVGVAMAAFALGAVVMPLLIDAEPLGRTAVSRMLEAGDACSSRLVLWSNVLDLIAQRPWLGWGWGELDYAHYITPYAGPRFCDILDNAHNLPLQLAVELGVPLAVMATLAAVAWVVRHRPWQEQDRHRQLAWLVLGLISVHSLVEYPLWTGPFFVAALVAVGALWRPSAGTCSGHAAHVAPVLGALLALAGLAMAWDYNRVSQIYLPPAQRSTAYQQDTLAKSSATWLFKDQAQFAELTTTPLTRANAQYMAALAERVLHFSPESRVVEILVESLVLLGRDAEAQVHLARFHAVFPKAYADWQQTNARAASGLR